MTTTPPAMTAADVRQHAAFSALMWALSYPGRPQQLPAGGLAAFSAIGEALIDLETSFFCPDPALRASLLASGARPLPPAQAAYHFYPRLGPAEVDLLAAAPTGTLRDPDLGATLVLGCALGGEQLLTMRGPGVIGALSLSVGGLHPALWELRQAAGPFPRGWDILLVAGDQVVGLPRTTSLEVR